MGKDASSQTIALIDLSSRSAKILYVVSVSISTVDVLSGSARHLYYLRTDEIVDVLKYNWISQPFGVMASAFGKASVAFLVLRIIGPNTVWRKWFVYANVALYMLVSISSCIIIFVQCTPSRALWEPVVEARCWNPTINANYSVFQSGKTILQQKRWLN